jgi:citrate lyase subunit beta/citryl-CoA lyase
MLFVPGGRPPMIEKAAVSEADAVCIDLEDSVPVDRKAEARAHAIRAFRELDFGRRVRMFRMNALDSPFAWRDLTEVVEAAGDRIDLVILPKASRPRDVEFVETLLAQIGAQIGIEAQIETASGFLYAREIAQSSPRLEALIFGPGDFSASMQMPASSIGEFDANDEIYPGHRWHAVMQTINLLFTPTEDEVAHATRVVQAYDLAAANGRGAVTLDGRMIDAANIRMARVVLEREKLGRKPDDR